MEENKDMELKADSTENQTAAEVTVKDADNKQVSETIASGNSSSEIEYEDYESHEVAPKPKKRFKKRFIVLGAVVLLVGGFFIYSANAAKKTVVFVDTKEATIGTIENILSISGTVQSADSKTYFSDVTAPVAKVNVKVGDKVSVGDVLCEYDTEAIDLAMQTAELAIKQAKGNYSSLYSGVGAVDRDYAKGMSLQQIQERLNQIEIEIQDLRNKQSEKKTRLQRTQTELNELLQDYNENGISDANEPGYNPYSRTDEDGHELHLQTENALKEISYALSNDPELISWDNQITALQSEQTHLSSAKQAYVNPGNASATKAQMESTTINQEDSISKLETAKEGIKSDYNGVVTSVSVVEGATVQAGTQLVTLANLDDVEVSVQISKSDLPKIAIGQQVDVTINSKPYSGEISKISGTATKNNNGVAVVDTTIKITNPDKDIILGVEANNKIHAQKADNTLVLPYEYVQTDSEGDYVYVYEDNTVVRKNVTIGIASSTEAQIIDGLSAGEKIITSGYDNLSEGMIVALNEQ